jgi:CHAT domain-containing protein
VSGDLPKAEGLANDAATSAQRFGILPQVPGFLGVLAEIQIAQHKYVEADQTYDRAAAIQDVMIGKTNSIVGKTALIKGAGDLYAKHFALIADHSGDVTKAFTILEQARGRVLTDLLISGAKTSPEAMAAEHKIAELRLNLMSAHSNQDIAQLRDAIFLAEQSRSITPEISILKAKEHQSVTLAQLQNSLSTSEVVLEYVADDPVSYCLIITSKGSRIAKLAGNATISPAVATYLKEVKAKHSARAEARQLYQLLLEPIPEVQTTGQVVIVRDGQLHLVPFDALVNTHGEYVLESQTVDYAPSATSFFLLRSAGRTKHPSHGLLAVGGVPYGHSNLKEAALTRGYSDAGLSDLPSSGEEARVAVTAFRRRRQP